MDIIEYSCILEDIKNRAGLPTVPSKREKELCKLLAKVWDKHIGMYTIDKIEGSCFDTWNVYKDGRQLFCMGETMDGYSIRYTDREDSWIDEFIAYVNKVLQGAFD